MRYLWRLVAICLAVSSPAMSETVTLICNNPYQPSNPPFTIELDQARSTVTQDVPATARVRASSGTYTATFTANEIKYNVNEWVYTIDRVTGNVTANAGAGAVMNFPCHVGKTQF